MFRQIIIFLALSLSIVSKLYAITDEHSIILAEGPIEINLQGTLQWLKADHNLSLIHI